MAKITKATIEAKGIEIAVQTTSGREDYFLMGFINGYLGKIRSFREYSIKATVAPNLTEMLTSLKCLFRQKGYTVLASADYQLEGKLDMVCICCPFLACSHISRQFILPYEQPPGAGSNPAVGSKEKPYRRKACRAFHIQKH